MTLPYVDPHGTPGPARRAYVAFLRTPPGRWTAINVAARVDPWLLPKTGGRLGMGGGFYDRSLAYRQLRKNWHKPTLLGLAHECQKVDHLALASWDVRLGAVVTDRRWYC